MTANVKTQSKAKFNNISFLSDLGTADGSVGIITSVIKSISPETNVIDITHDIAPYDIKGGGLVLARAVPYMAPGIVLGVVNPAATIAGSPIIVEVVDGGSYLIGPNNGLFGPAVALLGGATKAWQITNKEYFLETTSSQSQSRDILAPAAAHICNGVDIAELGEALDVNKLFPSVIAVSEISEDNIISAQVLSIDRFGNAQLNVDSEMLAKFDTPVTLKSDNESITAKVAGSIAEAGKDEAVIYIDSYGLVSIAMNRQSIATRLGLGSDSEIKLAPALLSNPEPVTVNLTKKPQETSKQSDA